MNKKLQQFAEKYPLYKVVNFVNPNSAFYFYDENGVLHRKDNLYRALTFKIGVQSAINKIVYIQHQLDKLEQNYVLICYKGMKGKSIVLLDGYTYSVVLYDLLQGHDVSSITCISTVNSNISKSRKCGFSRSKFQSLYKNRLVNLYLVELYNENESFYKIGLTCKKINQRFSGISKCGYKLKIIDTISIEGEKAYDKEKELKKLCKDFKYKPRINYPGYTESFNKQIKQIYEQFKYNSESD